MKNRYGPGSLEYSSPLTYLTYATMRALFERAQPKPTTRTYHRDRIFDPGIPWGYYHRPDVRARLGFIPKED